MMIDGTPDFNDVAKMTEAGSELAQSLGNLFPGFAMRSISKAESKATDRMLEDLKKIKNSQDSLGLSDESLSELMGNAIQRHSRNVNFDAVLKFAAPRINVDSNPSAIDRDWSEHFRDHAEKACDDDIRRTWAAILAGEINKPGSFSKRAMSILSDMGKKEAESFVKLCSYSTGLVANLNGKYVIAGRIIPVLVKDENGSSFNDGKIRLDELSTLDSLGLIDQMLQNVNSFPSGTSSPFLANDALVIATNTGSDKKIHFSGAVFRPVGLELAHICKLGCASNLAETLTKIFKENDLEVNITPIQTGDIQML